MLEQAEEAYQIGRILEAKKLAEDCVKRLDNAQRLSGYRLLSLCCLALDQQDDARRYAELVLEAVCCHFAVWPSTSRMMPDAMLNWYLKKIRILRLLLITRPALLI